MDRSSRSFNMWYIEKDSGSRTIKIQDSNDFES